MLERKEGLLTVVHRSFNGTSEMPEDNGEAELVEVDPGHFLRRAAIPASQSREKAFHP